MATVEKKRLGKKERRNLTITIVVVASIIGGAFAGFFILQAAMHTSIPVVVVTSGSMEPTINEGDILFIRGVDPTEIQAGSHDERTGDVIVYETQGIWTYPISEPVVHRVISKEYHDGKWWFETQGDANYSPDLYPIPEENVYGKVVGTIPKIGWVKLFLDRSGIAVPLLVFFAIMLVLSIIWDIYHPEKPKREEPMDNPSHDERKDDSHLSGQDRIKQDGII